MVDAKGQRQNVHHIVAKRHGRMPQNRLNTPLSILYALEICSCNDTTMIIENPNHASLASEQQLEDISPELVSVESYL